MKLSLLCREVGIDSVIAEPGHPLGPAPQAAGSAGGELDTLLAALGEREIAEVRDDSRAVQPGDLFVALPGQSVDGHQYVADAVARGAAAVVVEHPVELPAAAGSFVQLQVKSAPQSLAAIAANRYGRPADVLTLVGITGTNGKTTTNFLVESLLQEAGLVPGLIGTITYRYRGRSYPAPFTTPTALLLHRTLAEMGEQGVRAVTLEASSHALALGRLHGVRFRVAAFTNLTQDHLDFHHTMEEYYAAKASLFHHHLLPPELGGLGVINIDDSYGRRLAAELPPARRLTVSIDGPADITVLTERITIDGIAATLRTPVGEVAFHCGLTGRFNLANLALATGIGVALGLPAVLIGRGLSQVHGVAGRLERVSSARGGRGPSVFVDYAHTPDALARSLAALKPLTAPPLTATSPTGKRGRLLVVFGCGGDRDAGKRPQMGQVAARDADVVIVTSDNPRTENPQVIIDSIVAGLLQSAPVRSGQGGPPPRLDRQALAIAGHGFYVEPDRRQAITAAILSARADDVVLIAGKGHEDYQIIGTARHRFDDREEAQRALAQREAGPPRSGSAPLLSVTAPLAPTIELPVERVVSATQGKLLRSGPHKFSAVTIDSRLVIPGSLFVAVRGERHDGHSFLAQAVAAGATGVLVERDKAPPELGAGIAVIEVPDTLVALGQLARAHREAPEIAARLRVVAVTGSSGKTTTKDLIAAILTAHASEPGEVLKTDGNLNNHLGVPLTLLRLRPGQRYAVVEMGMSARGEIAYLTSLARPDVGVITNIGPAHLESLGSLANIALAKGELFAGLLDGAAVVYLGGPPRDAAADGGDRASLQVEVHKQAVRAGAASGRLRSFCAQTVRTASAPADGAVVQVALQAEGEDGLQLALHFPALATASEPLAVKLPLLGAHQADNAALAAAAALALEVPPAAIAAGLARVAPGKHRGQLLLIGGRHVLDDCYNANPASMAAALRTLTGLRGSHAAVAILGDMLELGPTEASLHAQLGEVAAECRLTRLITLGPRARHLAEAAQRRGVPTELVDTADDAARAAVAATQPGDFILLKGSRGMALEGVIDRLRALLPDPAAPAAAQQVH